MNNNQKKYILYGAASIGNIAKGTLEKCGVEIIGYIDKRAHEIASYNGLPVWEMDAVPREHIVPETIIYVSVKNVFEHEKIAHMLHNKGFCYILYKPYGVLLGYGSERENIISKIYDNMFEGNYNIEMEVPAFQIDAEKEWHDFAVAHKKENEVIAYIPAEFIFSNDYKDSGMEKWGNICIPAFFTHIDFFRFLNGDKTANPYDYLQEYCVFTAQLQKIIKVTDAWKNNVVENRTQIYEQMKDALDLDPGFFVRNAAEAEWNTRKRYFNLMSGKHRCTFQAALGKKYIPLKITKESYENFLNRDEVGNTMRILQETGMETVIPHPYFYRGTLVRDRGEHQFHLWFARYYGRKTYYEFGKVNFESLRVLDWTDDFGNFARFCVRLGCDVKRMVKPHALEKQLNCLFCSTIDYGGEIPEKTGNIIIGKAEELGVADGFLLGNKNTWIVRDADPKAIERLIKEYDFYIVEEVSAVCQAGNILKSCVLERSVYASDKK